MFQKFVFSVVSSFNFGPNPPFAQNFTAKTLVHNWKP